MNTMTSFVLDSRLENDSVFITAFELSDLRLMKDGDVDWFILIPRRPDKVEFMDLKRDEQLILITEIDILSRALRLHSKPKKINIGSLGNIVSQLHWHIIARFENDRAWPGALWGTKSLKPFESSRAEFWKKIFIEAKS
jgi:diadenosine tetraphosphate (Ap4A) HIT family hydrolase